MSAEETLNLIALNKKAKASKWLLLKKKKTLHPSNIFFYTFGYTGKAWNDLNIQIILIIFGFVVNQLFQC